MGRPYIGIGDGTLTLSFTRWFGKLTKQHVARRLRHIQTLHEHFICWHTCIDVLATGAVLAIEQQHSRAAVRWRPHPLVRCSGLRGRPRRNTRG